ncbi:MAG: DegT/DnrJ/EryC1/StrS family aminotransferase [Opitutales bacterium]|nr:DegT/DnrJ/EryC1/StrS family aminotransferase [Opitutales bacterium]
MQENPVPLFDLKKQYAKIRGEVRAAFDEVLDSQMMIGGAKVAAIEEAVAKYCGVKKAVALSSGTDALLAALMARGIYRSPLDSENAGEVIVPTFTFFATAGCVWRAGAKPVFADIDPDTFNMSAESLEKAITPRTKAIMPVHLFGQCADMDAIMEIANRRGIPVIEDCAQAIGASRGGVKAGAFGLCGCLSFFPTKNLGGFGDGGMVVSNDEHFAEEVARVRNHGMQPKYFHRSVGGNFRLDALQAAGLLVKLPHLDSWHEARRANAAFYNEAFAGEPKIKTPKIDPKNYSIYNQYVVRVPNRDEAIKTLRANGVNCEIYYPLPLHEQECFAALGYKRGDFPVAEEVARDCLALPIFPELEKCELEKVAEQLKRAVK